MWRTQWPPSVLQKDFPYNEGGEDCAGQSEEYACHSPGRKWNFPCKCAHLHGVIQKIKGDTSRIAGYLRKGLVDWTKTEDRNWSRQIFFPLTALNKHSWSGSCLTFRFLAHLTMQQAIWFGIFFILKNKKTSAVLKNCWISFSQMYLINWWLTVCQRGHFLKYSFILKGFKVKKQLPVCTMVCLLDSQVSQPHAHLHILIESLILCLQ